MPQQENLRDHRLAELAAIAQLYGAVSAPQERAAAEHQRAAMEMLGLIIQAHTEQQRQAFQQQQLEQQSQWHEGEQDVARQGHEDVVAQRREQAQLLADQRAESNRIHADEVVGRGEAGRYGHEQTFLAMTPEQRKAAALAYPDVYGEPYKNWHNAALAEAMPSATRDAKQLMALSPKAREGQWPAAVEKNEGINYVDFSNPALYAALPGAAAAPTSGQLTYAPAPDQVDFKPREVRNFTTGQLVPSPAAPSYNLPEMFNPQHAALLQYLQNLK